MSTATPELDDEMEAMLREIEGMGMTPEAPVSSTAAPAPATPPAPIETTEDAMAALEGMMADIEDIEATSATSDSADIVNTSDIDDIEAAVSAIETRAVEEKAAAAPAPKITAADLAKKRLKSEGYIVPEAKDAAVVSPDDEVPVSAIKSTAGTVVETGPTPTDPENIVKAKPVETPKSMVTKAAPAASSTSDILDPDQIKKDIAINPVDLDSALIEHPSLQLHYALKTADARRAYERLKSGVEILEAKLDASYRDKLFDGTKKPTEASIRNAVVADPQYAAAQAKLIDAQHLWKMCEAVESSFHSRKDILLEVARDRRKEKEGAMRVLEGEDLRSRVVEMMKK